jgi:hypothetical protein
MAHARWPLHAVVFALIAFGANLSACGSGEGPPDEPAGTKVAFSFCSDFAPIWLAVQDGDAPWVRLDPLSEGVYEARFTAPRGGVAYVSSSGGSLIVTYGNLTEIGTITCSRGFKYVTGTMTGVAEGAEPNVWLGGSYGVGAFYELLDVADGPADLIAAPLNYSPDGSYTATGIVIRRGQDPAANSQLPVIDFGSTESFAPSLASASVTGADGATRIRLTSSWHGRALPVADLSASNTVGPSLYAAVPQDRLGPGEFTSVGADVGNNLDRTSRAARVYFRAPVDKVVALGPELSTPVVTWQNPQRPRLQLTSQPEYARMVSITYQQNYELVSVAMTAAWLGGTPATWDLAVPDLSTVDGWNSAWGLGELPAISWRVIAEGGYDRGLGDTLHDGDTSAHATVDGGDGPFNSRADSGRGRAALHRGGFPELARRETK